MRTKKTIYVELNEGYEDEIIKVIEDKINYVVDRFSVPVDDKLIEDSKVELRTKAIDNLNAHTALRANLKDGWGFTIGEKVPVLVTFINKGEQGLGNITRHNNTRPHFIRKTDLTWEYNEDKEGFTYSELVDEVHKLLLEDAEISAYYSALSRMTNLGGERNARQ